MICAICGEDPCGRHARCIEAGKILATELDKPAKPNAKLKALLRMTPAWER